jgi:type I restriction enzyme S subunit
MPELPLGWREEPLGEVAAVRVSNVDKKSRPVEIPVRLCNYLDAYREDYLDESHPYMVATATPSEVATFGLRAGDVLVTKDSETPDDIGVAAVIEAAPDNLVCGYHLAIVRPTAQLNPVWLAKQFGTTRVQRYLAARATGSTRYGLSNATLGNLPIFVPLREEQDRIIEVLRTLDEAIRCTEQLIAKLQQMKQGLLDDLLTRGIDGNGEMRDPGRNPTQFDETRLGRLPTEWRVETLANVAALVTSGSRGWAKYYSERGAFFIRIGNLSRESIDLRLTEVAHVRPPAGGEGERTRVEEGDLLISITADLGITAVVPEGLGEAYTNQHIALVRVDPLRVNPRWLGHFMAACGVQTQIRRHDDPGAKAGLNLPTVRGLFIAVPPITEQDEMASRLDAASEAITGEEAYREKLNLLKIGLSEDLLTGRVRVTKLLEGSAA